MENIKVEIDSKIKDTELALVETLNLDDVQSYIDALTNYTASKVKKGVKTIDDYDYELALLFAELKRTEELPIVKI